MTTVHKAQMRETKGLADTSQKPRARAKHSQILDSARVLFLDQGFDATSMDAIAREAGVSKATLYVHFDDKDDLLLALVNEECKRFGPKTLWRDHGGKIDLRAELHAIGTTFLEAFLDQRGLAVHRLVMSCASRYPRVAEVFMKSDRTAATPKWPPSCVQRRRRASSTFPTSPWRRRSFSA